MKKLDVIIGCILFVILFSMLSCGSRKVSKSETKEEVSEQIKLLLHLPEEVHELNLRKIFSESIGNPVKKTE